MERRKTAVPRPVRGGPPRADGSNASQLSFSVGRYEVLPVTGGIPNERGKTGRNAIEKPGVAGGLEGLCQPAVACEPNSNVEPGSKSGATPLMRLVRAWIYMM